MARVLVVDDEPDMEVLVRQKFKRSVTEKRFDLLFANSGVDALDILKAQTIDVLVTDVNMPGMDGLTLLEEVQACSPQTRSIIVSAYGDTQTLRRAMNHGAFDFVTKPVDFSQLEDTISQAVSVNKCPLIHKTSDLLSSYQTILRENFPSNKGIQLDLDISNEDTSWLGNAWYLGPDHMGLLLIHATSPRLMEPLAVILAERTLQKQANTCPRTTLRSYLDASESSLTVSLCYGVLQLKTYTWGFAHKGPFQVIHEAGKDSHIVSTDQTTLLSKNEGVKVQAPAGPGIRIRTL